VRVVRGAWFDVAVDIGKSLPTFVQWVGVELTEDNHGQFWIPAGFAHRYVALSDTADFLYKPTDYYAPEHKRGIVWNDPVIGIQWLVEGDPVLLAKGLHSTALAEAEHFA
jgi:dTDP-4-dehydrorhamnose 3,5-epimerase